MLPLSQCLRTGTFWIGLFEHAVLVVMVAELNGRPVASFNANSGSG